MGKVKKILFVTHTGELSSGGEISNYTLMGYLRRKGFEIHIAFPSQGDENYMRAMRKIGVTPHALSYKHWQEEDPALSEIDIKAVYDICEIIQKFNPDVVVTNTTVVPWGAFAAALTNKPHVWVAREFPIGDYKYLGEKMDFIQGFSNQVMANSRQLATYLTSEYNFPVSHFYSYTDVKNIKLNNKITNTRLVSPNSIYNRKNQKEFMQALAILVKHNKDFDTKVVLIGHRDPSYWSEIDEIIKAEQLQDLVEVHEFTSNPWELIGTNDILVQTSISESIGRTTTEAMKLGIPVIASDIPGHKEAFELGGGTLYESGNPKDLADKISQVLSNVTHMKKQALVTRQAAIRNMSEETCNQPFLDELVELKGQDNPQKVLRHMSPYLYSYVTHQQDLAKIHDETLGQQKQLNDSLLASRAYKLGRIQTTIIKKLLQPIVKR